MPPILPQGLSPEELIDGNEFSVNGGTLGVSADELVESSTNEGEEDEEREQADAIREDIEERQSEGDILGEASERLNLAAETTLDPATGFSLQESVQNILTRGAYAADPSVSIEDAGGIDEAKEETARSVQQGFLGIRQGLAEAPREAGEGTPLSEEGNVDVPVPGTDETVSTYETSDNLASFAGGTFDAFFTSPVREGLTAVSGVDPLGDEEMGFISESDPGEATGSTEETGRVAEPATDIGLALATGGIGLVAPRAARALGRNADEVASAGRRVEGFNSGASETGEQASMSVLDDIAQLGVRGVDEVPTQVGDDIPVRANDDVVEAQNLATANFDEFQSGFTSPGTADNFLRRTDTAVEESLPSFDEVQGLFRGGDETATDLPTTVDEVDEVRTPDGVPDADAGLAGTGLSFSGFVDDVGQTFSRSTDEAQQFLSGGQRAGDDLVGGAARTTDEAAQTADEGFAGGAGGGGGGGDGGGFISTLRGLFTPTRAAGAGLLGGLGIGGSVLLGSSAFDGSQVPGRSESGGWVYEKVESLSRNGRGGAIVSVSLGTNQLGFSVIVGTSPLRVLASSGNARSANISTQELNNGVGQSGRDVRDRDHLEPVFDSRQSARRAFEQFAAEEAGGNTAGETRGDSDVWDGSLNAPSNVNVGEGFNVEASVRNTTSGRASSSFILGVATSGGVARLDSSRTALAGNSSQTLSFNVRNTTSRLQAGDYTLILFSDGTGGGRIASANVRVTGSGSDSSPEANSEWGPASIEGNLGNGWYLVSQAKKDGSEARYMGAGQREDGTRIYLRSGGQVREQPEFFDSADAVRQAYQQWLNRARNGQTGSGETPTESGGRPSPSGVTRDANRNSGPSRLLLVGGGIALFVAIWYISGGEPVQWLQEQFSGLSQSVQNVIPG